MQITNSERSYGLLSIGLHWLGAIGVILLLVIGLQADWAGEAGDRARRAELMAWHISVGVTFAAVLLARVVSHYGQKQPTPVPQPRAMVFVSKGVQHMMLLAVVLLVISGPMAVWSAGRALNVWDAFSIPGPFAERNEAVHETAETIHAIGRYMLYVLIPLHILGALKQALIDKSDSLKRMLAPLK